MNRAESAQGAATQRFPQGGLPLMSQQGPAGTGGSGSGTPTPRRVLQMSQRWDFPAQLLMPPQVPGSPARRTPTRATEHQAAGAAGGLRTGASY